MRLLRSRVFVGVMAATLGALTASVTAQAGRPQESEDTTRALLVEVRALRVAMERLGSVGPRVQLAFGRLQLQEQRIATLAQQLDAVRLRIEGDVTGTRRELRDQEQELQQQIATEQGRWAEINQRVEELDRTLAAASAPGR